MMQETQATQVSPEVTALYRRAVAERDAAEAVVVFFDRMLETVYGLRSGDTVHPDGTIVRAASAARVEPVVT